MELDWLDRLDLRWLMLWLRSPVSEIPQKTLGRLEVLSLSARLDRPITTDRIPRITSLSIDQRNIDGHWSAADSLESVELGRTSVVRLGVFEHCARLISLVVDVVGQARSAEWVFDSATDLPIEYLKIEGPVLRTLEGVERLPRLQRLIVNPHRTPKPPPRIDLRPLASCRQIELVGLDLCGVMTHSEMLDELPALQRVTTSPQGLEPMPDSRPWLLVR
ncbi:hypothetical protein [Antribacter gilvus]|uniref:hypothetical protein n=1 Tax=Antribacter gilvus TaxID=2304675 RepID=UPI000F787841|nr:hypothetical protein [Antribacter gilvus]